jgi:hypothetical protein
MMFFKGIWFTIHFIETSLVIYFLYKLRNIKDEFSISTELITVGCFWIGFELIFVTNSSFYNNISPNVIIVLDIFKNYLIILVSGLFPLIKSFRSNNIPVCTTKECAANFNLLLITEKAYDAFYEYLRINMHEGMKFLSFWTEVNVFKHSKNDNKVSLLSTDIYDRYLNLNSDLYIDFPPNLIEKLNISYKNTSKTQYCDVFDDLADYAYVTLKDYYYPSFKVSPSYKTLEEELEKEEIIYSRLVASSMISNIEI